MHGGAGMLGGWACMGRTSQRALDTLAERRSLGR